MHEEWRVKMVFLTQYEPWRQKGVVKIKSKCMVLFPMLNSISPPIFR